ECSRMKQQNITDHQNAALVRDASIHAPQFLALLDQHIERIELKLKPTAPQFRVAEFEEAIYTRRSDLGDGGSRPRWDPILAAPGIPVHERLDESLANSIELLPHRLAHFPLNHFRIGVQVICLS